MKHPELYPERQEAADRQGDLQQGQVRILMADEGKHEIGDKNGCQQEQNQLQLIQVQLAVLAFFREQEVADGIHEPGQPEFQQHPGPAFGAEQKDGDFKDIERQVLRRIGGCTEKQRPPGTDVQHGPLQQDGKEKHNQRGQRYAQASGRDHGHIQSHCQIQQDPRGNRQPARTNPGDLPEPVGNGIQDFTDQQAEDIILLVGKKALQKR